MTIPLTQGKPYKQIILFTIPLLLGNLFQQFYNMADAFIVSRTLGIEAFAGISSTSGISFLILGFAQGLAAGLSIAVAQSYGAQDYAQVRKHYTHNLMICVVVAAILTILSLICARWILNIMQTPSDIWQYAYDYLFIIFAGIIASMMYNFYANILRAFGDSRTPLYFLLLAAALNIALDILLILYTPLGVSGAAWATVISQAVSAALCARTVRKRLQEILPEHSFKGFEKNIITSNLKIGLPMAFQSSIIALGVIIIQFATNGMGTIAVAAYSVAGKIDGIAVEPLRSFGMTMSTFTAQNYGAKKYQRILDGVRQCIIISIIASAVLGMMMFAFGKQITAVFVGAGQTEILTMSHSLLMIHGALYIILALLFVYRFTLQGLGHTTIPTIAGTMELVMRFLAAVFLIPYFGFTGASIATPLSWFGALVPVAIAYFFARKSLMQKAKETPEPIAYSVDEAKPTLVTNEVMVCEK